MDEHAWCQLVSTENTYTLWKTQRTRHKHEGSSEELVMSHILQSFKCEHFSLGLIWMNVDRSFLLKTL